MGVKPLGPTLLLIVGALLVGCSVGLLIFPLGLSDAPTPIRQSQRLV